MTGAAPAPELITSEWLNCTEAQSLAMHRGKVVVVDVFQMLCPGCVSHSLPQAQRIHQTFPVGDVVVLGLHSVFEHHDAMTPTALKAFMYEYGISFPVGVDALSGESDLPQTMLTYSMQGTPTILLIGRDGALAAHHFGQVPDLRLGAEIATLMSAPAAGKEVAADIYTGTDAPRDDAAAGCDGGVCTLHSRE